MESTFAYHQAFVYVALSAVLCAVLWAPYVVARLATWGLPTFIHNYAEGFPAQMPEQPLWASRSQRAHLNLVETLPPFIGVVLAAAFTGADVASVTLWATVFFYARVAHAVVYVVGVPYLRTPVYLASWLAILMIGVQAIA